MTVIDELVRNADSYGESFSSGDLPLPPVKRVAVVVHEGDAHVIRNAGGVITDDEIRSLSISQRLLGTEEIMLIHHTDCGMLKVSNEEFHQLLEAESGERPDWHTMSFSDLEGSVRNSIERIKASPFIPRTDAVRGFIYDVHSGLLEEVR